jgi:hypothetical protein
MVCNKKLKKKKKKNESIDAGHQQKNCTNDSEPRIRELITNLHAEPQGAYSR